jgi:hypothetical protein
MADGYDYDYLLPRDALPRVLTEMAAVWPAWVLEGERNSLLSRDAFTGVLPPSTEDGFVLYRDAGMRERFHRDGGFVDADGSAPIVVWISGSDEAMVQVDFVIDVLPPSAFLARFQDIVATAIGGAVLTTERGSGWIRYSTPMDGDWVVRNWEQAVAADPALRASSSPAPTTIVARQPSDPGAQGVVEIVTAEPPEPALVEAIERAIVRLHGCWHRIAHHPFHDERGNRLESFTMPPGDVVANGECLVLTGRGAPLK